MIPEGFFQGDSLPSRPAGLGGGSHLPQRAFAQNGENTPGGGTWLIIVG